MGSSKYRRNRWLRTFEKDWVYYDSITETYYLCLEVLQPEKNTKKRVVDNVCKAKVILSKNASILGREVKLINVVNNLPGSNFERLYKI